MYVSYRMWNTEQILFNELGPIYMSMWNFLGSKNENCWFCPMYVIVSMWNTEQIRLNK